MNGWLNCRGPNTKTIRYKSSKKVLDDDHYDLEKVKERIFEYLKGKKAEERKDELPYTLFYRPSGSWKDITGKTNARSLKGICPHVLGGVRDLKQRSEGTEEDM